MGGLTGDGKRNSHRDIAEQALQREFLRLCEPGSWAARAYMQHMCEEMTTWPSQDFRFLLGRLDMILTKLRCLSGEITPGGDESVAILIFGDGIGSGVAGGGGATGGVVGGDPPGVAFPAESFFGGICICSECSSSMVSYR